MPTTTVVVKNREGNLNHLKAPIISDLVKLNQVMWITRQATIHMLHHA